MMGCMNSTIADGDGIDGRRLGTDRTAAAPLAGVSRTRQDGAMPPHAAASPRRVVALLCLAEALSMTSFAAYPSFLPLLRDLWHLGGAQAGFVGGAFFFGYMLAVPLLSGITDRLDARAVFASSCVLTAA